MPDGQKISAMSLVPVVTGGIKLPTDQSNGVGGNLAVDIDQLIDFIGLDAFGNFWPLQGEATLVDDVVIAGDEHLIYFSNLSLFNVVVNGVGNSSQIEVYPDNVSITGGEDIQLNADDQLILQGQSVEIEADDGVDSSSFSLSPTELNIDGDLYISIGGINSVDFIDVYTTNGLHQEAYNGSEYAELDIFPNYFNLFSSSSIAQVAQVTGEDGVLTLVGLEIIIGGETILTWYNSTVDNSGGGSPLATNIDVDVFGATQDASASIIFHISAVASDGAEAFGGTITTLIRRDGTANPTFISEYPVLQADNINANAASNTNGANVRLTLTTPAGEIYKWKVLAKINMQS